MKNYFLSALMVFAVGSVAGGCSPHLIVDNYRYGTIEVQAWLDNGEPAEGVDLLLYRNTEHLAYGRTNAEGQYTFTFAPDGSLGVVASLSAAHSADAVRWADYRDEIEVPNGRVAQVVFTRLPGPPAANQGALDDGRRGLEEVRAACPTGGEATTAISLQDVAIRGPVLVTDSSGAGAGDCS